MFNKLECKRQFQETSASRSRVRMGRRASGTVRGWMDTAVNVHLISREEIAKVINMAPWKENFPMVDLSIIGEPDNGDKMMKTLRLWHFISKLSTVDSFDLYRKGS